VESKQQKLVRLKRQLVETKEQMDELVEVIKVVLADK